MVICVGWCDVFLLMFVKNIWYEGEKEWSFLDHTLVQILVVVAISQMRTLTADVRKVFNAIAISIE